MRDASVSKLIAAIANRAANAVAEAKADATDPKLIADAAERRMVATAIMRNVEAEPRDRLKAADLLNRMDAIYVQKVDVTHHTKPDLTKLSDAELAVLEQMMAKAAPVVEAVH